MFEVNHIRAFIDDTDFGAAFCFNPFEVVLFYLVATLRASKASSV
jgi:hypothetical protein